MEKFYVVSEGSKKQKRSVINLLAKLYKFEVNEGVFNLGGGSIYTHFYPYNGQIHAGFRPMHACGAKEISIAELKRKVSGKSVKPAEKEFTRAMEIDGVSYILKSWQIDAVRKIIS